MIVPQQPLFHHTEPFRFAERSAIHAGPSLTKVAAWYVTSIARWSGSRSRSYGTTACFVRPRGTKRSAVPPTGSVPHTHGSNSIGFFSCSKSTNEMNFIAQKLARAVMGTNNIDSCNRT